MSSSNSVICNDHKNHTYEHAFRKYNIHDGVSTKYWDDQMQPVDISSHKK